MSEILLTVVEAAKFLNIGERGIRKNALAGKYGEIQYADSVTGGGTGGKALRIPLTGLPPEAQTRYHRIMTTTSLATDETAASDEAFNRAPDWNRQEAYDRYLILKAFWAYQDSHPEQSKTKSLKQFIQSFRLEDGTSLSEGTLYRYETAYREKRLAGLLTGYGRNKGHSEIDPAIWDDFCALYMGPVKRSIGYCYRRLRSQWGDDLPALRTFQRQVKLKIPAAVQAASRNTAKYLYDRHLPYILRDPESVAGNQVWVSDHFKADFSILGKNGQPVRPWITAWMDFRSRKIVGCHVDYAPSTATIIASFAEAAMNPDIGLPLAILLDNGRDYSSKELTDGGFRKKNVPAKAADSEKEIQRVIPLMERLGIAAHFAKPENARAKPIEREFRTFAEELCKEFDTYCGNRPEAKPDDLNRKLKAKNLPKYAITLEELSSLLRDWILYVKNEQPSQGKGREGEKPNETFARTRLPLRLAPPAELKILFKRQSQPVKVDRCMVTFRGRKYFHPKLATYNETEVYLRYLDSDPNTVSVWTLEDSWIVDAEIVSAMRAFGASPEEHEAEARRVKQAKEEIQNHPAIAAKQRGKPDTFEGYIAKAKRTAKPEAPPPNVIHPVNVGQNIRDSVRRMAVGQTPMKRYDVMGILGNDAPKK